VAAMTTVLEARSPGAEYTAPSHTISKPVLVLQSRKTPSANGVIAEDVVSVLHGTVDSNGDALPQKVLFSATVRRPYTGATADRDAALTLFREIVASDNFTDIVTGQDNLQ